VFAGALEDGVFCSTDRGTYWSSWNFGLLDLNVIYMAVSPDFANDETVFVGTETGIFRSTNGGRAWREVGFPTELAPVLALAISPRFAADQTLFAGTEQGLHRSTDQGANWSLVSGVNGSVNAIVLDDKALLLSCDTALLRSSDGGESWTAQTDDRLAEGIAALCAPAGLNQPVLVAPIGAGVLRL
jgi:photosystem II stability/assembly factor-like uncharacterized protein